MLLALASSVFLAACGSAPASAGAHPAADILLAASARTIDDRVPPDATLEGVLAVHQIGHDVAQLVVAAARTAFNPRELRAGQPYRIVSGTDGTFESFEYTIDNDRFLRVAESPAGGDEPLSAQILTYPKQRQTAAIGGRIDAAHPSLIAAIEGAGERIDLALRLAEIFNGQIDFNSDVQPDDRFEVLFEKDSRDGQFAGYGNILAAALVNGDRRLQAFRFTAPDGSTGYFDEEGHSVRRSFLRSPLPFTPRVTSRFSRARRHPVSGVVKAHLGVDYAAPIGTPVLAVADGVVVSAGFSGASGRLIRLRHANRYQSYYLHLSSIGKGIRPGRRVSQGDVIGRVGASGVVTGPHLDYRLAKNGVFLDPLEVQRALPPATRLDNATLVAFQERRDDVVRDLEARLRQPEALAAGNRHAADSPLQP
jgi:murein DD-endopeptidase MepM/ murein hydrolase activator NlpD